MASCRWMFSCSKNINTLIDRHAHQKTHTHNAFFIYHTPLLYHIVRWQIYSSQQFWWNIHVSPLNGASKTSTEKLSRFGHPARHTRGARGSFGVFMGRLDETQEEGLSITIMFKHGKRCFWFSDTEDGLFSKSSTMGTMKIMKYPPCPQYPPWVDSLNHDISWDLGSVAVPHGGCPKIWPCNEGHRRPPKVPRSPRLEAMGVGTRPLGHWAHPCYKVPQLAYLVELSPCSWLHWVFMGFLNPRWTSRSGV